MAKADDVLKEMILFHGKKAAREVVGDLPAQVRDARRDIRSLQKDIASLMKKVDKLLQATSEKPPVPAASQDEVEKARFTKRTLPAIRKKFGLTLKDLAKLLEVSPLTVSTWEQEKAKPRAKSLAKIIALRSMTQKEIDAALGREGAAATMSAQEIRELRKGRGLSRAEFAKMLGVSASAVMTWEQGKSTPRGQNLEALARLQRRRRSKGKVREGKRPRGGGRETGCRG